MTIHQSPATDCQTLHRDAHERNLISSILGDVLNRVAALEAAAAPAPQPAPDHLGDATNMVAPAGKLVENILLAMQREDWLNNGLDESVCNHDDPSYRYTSAAMRDDDDVYTLQARAAIHAVADWLELRGNHGSAAELRKEADQ